MQRICQTQKNIILFAISIFFHIFEAMKDFIFNLFIHFKL